MIRSSPNLAVDDLSNLLLAHGYGVAMTALNGAAMPTSGVCGALRFGDDVRLRADGLHRRVGVSDCVVKLALQVRGVGSGAVTRWRLRKTFPPLALDKPVRLLFEIDLLVSGDLTAALIRAYGRDLYRLLCRLLGDLRRAIFGAPPLSRNGTIVYAEFAVIGDLTVGRSGLVRGSPPGSAADHLLRLAVCERLGRDVLPDLGRVLRDAVTLAAPTSGAIAPATAALVTTAPIETPPVQPFALARTLTPSDFTPSPSAQGASFHPADSSAGSAAPVHLHRSSQ